MERPRSFEHVRFLGDKRTQLVYDLDEWEDAGPIEDLVAAGVGLAFAPDTLAEARNRGYTLARPGALAASPQPPVLSRRRPVNGTFTSGGYELSRHLVVPTGRIEPRPGVILCHGFPIGPLDARRSGGTFPQLIDRIAHELGYAAMTFNFRGTGSSGGDFSLQGWVDDLRTAIDELIKQCDPTEVVLLGTNTGGSIAICVAADDPRVRAAALLSPRADFDDWAEQPRRFLEHAREIGAVRAPQFPPSMEEWSRAFRRFRPTDAARRFAPRPLLVMHGDDDESVPTSDARQLAEAHGAAELSLLAGAGHRLRHDPRAIALLLGWLDRVRNIG